MGRTTRRRHPAVGILPVHQNRELVDGLGEGQGGMYGPQGDYAFPTGLMYSHWQRTNYRDVIDGTNPPIDDYCAPTLRPEPFRVADWQDRDDP